MNLYDQIKRMWFPCCGARVVITYNPQNSMLAKKLNQTLESTHEIQGVEERGILIGDKGHLQLIEWNFVKTVTY